LTINDFQRRILPMSVPTKKLRKPRVQSKAAVRLFGWISRNIYDRLDHLGQTPANASMRSGHYPTWISDALNKSAWISIAFLADVADALNVPVDDLVSQVFDPDLYPEPSWMRRVISDEEHPD